MRLAVALAAALALPLLLPLGAADGWEDPNAVVLFRLDVAEGTTAQPLSLDLDRDYGVHGMMFTCFGASGTFALVGPEGARIEGACGPVGGWTSASGRLPAGLYVGAAAFQASRPIFFEVSGIPAS